MPLYGVLPVVVGITAYAVRNKGIDGETRLAIAIGAIILTVTAFVMAQATNDRKYETKH